MASASARAAICGLYGIVDTSAAPQLRHLDLGRALLQAGVSVLQLRMKDTAPAEQLPILQGLKRAADEAGAELIVNDHVHLAAEVSGVGVHLGQQDMSPRDARAVLGESALIGLSTHNLLQAREAENQGVDYIGYGPVFSSAGKHRGSNDRRPPQPPVGLASLKVVVSAATVPVVAIGGIDLNVLPLLVATGVDAVAVISAISCAEAPVDLARSLHTAFRFGADPARFGPP